MVLIQNQRIFLYYFYRQEVDNIDIHRLIANFKEEDLKEIAKTGKKVVLIKRNSEGDSIVWAAFKPWQHNRIEWDDNYAIYATTDIQNGKVIQKLTEKSARPGLQYHISYGFFEETQDECDKSSYAVKHMMEEYDIIVVGLAQDIMINGQLYQNCPTNMVRLCLGSIVHIHPTERIEVGVAAGAEISMMLDNPLINPFYFECNEMEENSIAYDGETGTFV